MPKVIKSGPPSKIKLPKSLSSDQAVELLKTLQTRFEKNMNRHKGLDWAKIQEKLENNLSDLGTGNADKHERKSKLASLNDMEATGGEPDVVGFDEEIGEYIFFDCSAETPKGRVSTCYDLEGEKSRKYGKPAGNAIDVAFAMGVEVLTEEQYRELQRLGEFDLKTSSWVQTPVSIRKLGGAVFCDRRYGTVFLYHNGAQSFYNSRGFRGELRV